MPLNEFEFIEYLGIEEKKSIIKVKNRKNGLIYILKRIKFQYLDKDDKQNELKIIKILFSLKHPNVIEIKEVFFDKPSKSLNVVMEYANNNSLRSKINYAIKNGMFLEENIIWDVLTQILHGLNYLHKKGIIHRNLTSKNIFLTKSRLVKINDFKACCLMEKNKKVYAQIGTPFYTPPEIWNEQPYDYKCDIWSVGCIIYEMASLSLPFISGDLNSLYKKIMSKKIKSIPDFYSENLKTIINNMLSFNPSKRPSTEVLLNYPNIKETTNKLNYIYNNINDIKINDLNNKRKDHYFKSQNLENNKNIQLTGLKSNNKKNKEMINIGTMDISNFNENIKNKNKKYKIYRLINKNIFENKKNQKLNENLYDISYKTIKERKRINSNNYKEKNEFFSTNSSKTNLHKENNFTDICTIENDNYEYNKNINNNIIGIESCDNYKNKVINCVLSENDKINSKNKLKKIIKKNNVNNDKKLKYNLERNTISRGYNKNKKMIKNFYSSNSLNKSHKEIDDLNTNNYNALLTPKISYKNRFKLKNNKINFIKKNIENKNMKFIKLNNTNKNKNKINEIDNLNNKNIIMNINSLYNYSLSSKQDLNINKSKENPRNKSKETNYEIKSFSNFDIPKFNLKYLYNYYNSCKDSMPINPKFLRNKLFYYDIYNTNINNKTNIENNINIKKINSCENNDIKNNNQLYNRHISEINGNNSRKKNFFYNRKPINFNSNNILIKNKEKKIRYFTVN